MHSEIAISLIDQLEKELLAVRPFLIQSDSTSRKRPFSTGFFFDWILLVLLLIVSQFDFIVFVLFLEAVGVEYCTASEIGWQLCASRFLCEQRLDDPSSQRVGGFGLSRKKRSWSWTQPRAAKTTTGAAVVGSMGSRPRAAAIVWCCCCFLTLTLVKNLESVVVLEP